MLVTHFSFGGRVAAGRHSLLLVCLLLAARQQLMAAFIHPSVQTGVKKDRPNTVSLPKPPDDLCAVSLQLDRWVNGSQNVTVSVPEHCGCTELKLSVLQRRGIPCSASASSCSWMRAHRAPAVGGSASFLEAVAGLFRPAALCRRPATVAGGRRRTSRLLVGTPATIRGLDLLTWNTSIAAAVHGDALVVEVLRQTDGSDTDAYFPELFVTLYRPPGAGEGRYRRVAYQRVQFSPAAHGARAEFQDAALGDLYRYRVDVRPAGSWVCQGANDGCQKRLAPVDELLELTEQALIEQARAEHGVVA